MRDCRLTLDPERRAPAKPERILEEVARKHEHEEEQAGGDGAPDEEHFKVPGRAVDDGRDDRDSEGAGREDETAYLLADGATQFQRIALVPAYPQFIAFHPRQQLAHGPERLGRLQAPVGDHRSRITLALAP